MTNELTTDEIKELAEACGLKVHEACKGYAWIIDEDNSIYLFDPIDNDVDNHKVLMALVELCKVKILHLEIRPSFAMHKLRITSPMEDEVYGFDEFSNESIARALLAVLKIK